MDLAHPLLPVLAFVALALVVIGAMAVVFRIAASLLSRLLRGGARKGLSGANKILIVCAAALAYYAAFFTCKFTVFENLTLHPAHYQISENCIIVRGQAVTGPQIRVVEGSEFLLASVPAPHPEDLNANEIEMTGKSIYNSILDYPDYYACDWLIYGRAAGFTDQYAICGDGTIPVFETERVYPMMTLSDFLGLEIILGVNFPWGLALAGFLYFWPASAMLALFPRRKKDENRS